MSVELIEYINEEIRVADMDVGDHAFERGDIAQILDPVRHSVETEFGKPDYEASLARFSRPQRLANAVFAYCEMVQTLGHCEFFNCAEGVMWEDALAGLREMGASKNVIILSGATLRVGGTPPFDFAKRQSMISMLKPKMADLDRQFYGCDPGPKLWSYMKLNQLAFEFRGQSAR